jgi:phage replication O-like protein O
MSNPQAENGHTDIANEIFDALARIRIPGEARQVMDFIIRKTWGWHKKEDCIALSQFVDGTGLSKVAVCKAIQKLIGMNLIITQKGNDLYTSYCFNKHYDLWKPLPKKVTNIGRVLKGRVSIKDIKKGVRERDNNICLCCGYNGNVTKENLHIHHIDFNQGNNAHDNLITLCKSCHGKAHNNNSEYKAYLKTLITQNGNEVELPNREISITQNINLPLPKKVHSKETISKETTKEKECASFDAFWSAYPNKKDRIRTKKIWDKMNPTDDLLNEMLVAIKKQIAWRTSAGPNDFRPHWKHPATWLNAGSWMDVIESETTFTPFSERKGAERILT